MVRVHSGASRFCGDLSSVGSVRRDRGVTVPAVLTPAIGPRPDKVERVLHNLLTNALRHTPNDGSIAVVLTPGAGELTIAVEDTGEGLSDATAERMFEQFWRGERSRTSIGSGLGLAIASRLVELQGGRIWAESRTAGGARIAFTLPTAP
jgi:signal transduction histidine kinase